jgi:hypothetical protein
MVTRPYHSPASVDRVGAAFEWRVNPGRWRWLILSALGAAPSACGGRTGANTTDSNGVDLEQGGSHGTSLGYGGTSTLAYGGAQNQPVGEGGVTSAGGAPPTATASVCDNPVSLGGGWERCDSGVVHRVAVGECASSLPRPEPVFPETIVDAGAFTFCRSDADCLEAPYGHCERGNAPFGGAYCAYGCTLDSDCGSDQVCLCGDAVGTCASASCRTDADCGSGRLCADYVLDPGCGGTGFACQTPEDECVTPSDCVQPDSYRYCWIDASVQGSHRVCSSDRCSVGRPFLVHGGERLAPPCARTDWYTGAAAVERSSWPEASLEPELNPALRAELARSWTLQGLMEHASVAAFARFTLQLMSLGAPASLVQRSGEAMQDEIRHARSCFELARDYAADDVGPGPLQLDGALEGSDLSSIVLNTILEGCIGETVAAYEAAEARAHCEEPRARALLERIAAEESQHAELAWQFVAWALANGPRELGPQVRDAFAAALAGARANRPRPSAFERELLRHGVVGSELRQSLRERVLEQVVAPCARALLEPAAPPRASVSASWS